MIRLNNGFDFSPYQLDNFKKEHGIDYTYSSVDSVVVKSPTVGKRKGNSIFQIWSKIIRHERYTKAPYTDYTVCEEWHTYENFEKWYKENVYAIGNEKIVLTHDLLKFDNHCMCPEYCVFAPYKIIGALGTKYRDKDIGIIYNPNRSENFPYRAYCQYNGNNVYIGRSDNLEEIKLAYKLVKEYEVKRIAEEYKGKIPDVLYQRMANFEYNENDYL